MTCLRSFFSPIKSDFFKISTRLLKLPFLASYSQNLSIMGFCTQIGRKMVKAALCAALFSSQIALASAQFDKSLSKSLSSSDFSFSSSGDGFGPPFFVLPPIQGLSCNAKVVDKYLNNLSIPLNGDLAWVLSYLPTDPLEAQAALEDLHPAIFQNLSFQTDENMITVRQTFTGRADFLRHYRCKFFKGLINDRCNVGITQFWMTPYATFLNQTDRGCLIGYKGITNPGVAMGFDSQPNSHFIGGMGVAYTYSNMHYRHSGHRATTENAYFGTYATWMNSFAYLNAAVLGSYQWYVVKRDIDFVDFHAKNRHHGYAVNTHLGFGFKLDFCGLEFEPFANADYDYVNQDGYREKGAGPLDLRVRANHNHLLRTEAGLMLSHCMPYNCATFRPSATVSYVRKNVLSGEKFKANLIDYEETFVAKGTNRAIDMVAPGIGLEILFSNNHILSFTWDAELAKKQWTQRVMLRFERLY